MSSSSNSDKPEEDRSGWLTTVEAARQSRYHVNHIRRLYRQGKIRGEKRYINRLFIDPQSLDDYIEKEGRR